MRVEETPKSTLFQLGSVLISKVSNGIDNTNPIQPDKVNPMLMNEPCAPDIKPRECGGDTSEKYVGIAAIVRPAANPVIKRPTSHCEEVSN
jgi:hypothetical protein